MPKNLKLYRNKELARIMRNYHRKRNYHKRMFYGAGSKKRRWTVEEKRMLFNNPYPSDTELAKALKRSVQGIQVMRYKLTGELAYGQTTGLGK